MSKNRHTIEHLVIACRHVKELMAAGVTENHAIRTLELLTDYYANLHLGGRPGPHHVKRVPREQWSLAARQLHREKPDLRPQDHLRVEHGTPRRALARLVMKLYDEGQLNEFKMDELVRQYWKLAVITLEEDRRLNQLARAKVFEAPDLRWAAAGIQFADPDLEPSN